MHTLKWKIKIFFVKFLVSRYLVTERWKVTFLFRALLVKCQQNPFVDTMTKGNLDYKSTTEENNFETK